MDQKRREKNFTILEWFDALVLALTMVLILLLFLIRTVNVDGSSMVPTLQDGEQLLARSVLYKPQRGDIVVVDSYISYGAPLIKRVIAVGGDTVDIDIVRGVVIVNGETLDEPYVSAPTHNAGDMTFPLTVPEGMVFLLGDNRPSSKDSRYAEIGLIDERDILGKVFFRILPFSEFGAAG